MNHLKYGYFKHLKMIIQALFFENIYIYTYILKFWELVFIKKLTTILTRRDLVKTHLCAVASHRVWWLINPCPAWFDRHLMPANFIQGPTTPKWPKMQLQRTLNLFRIILALGHNDRRKISGYYLECNLLHAAFHI